VKINIKITIFRTGVHHGNNIKNLEAMQTESKITLIIDTVNSRVYQQKNVFAILESADR